MSTPPSSTSSRRSPSRRATACDPFTARAHRDLAAALRDRGRPGDAAAAAEHDAAATAIADEIGLALGPI